MNIACRDRFIVIYLTIKDLSYILSMHLDNCLLLVKLVFSFCR